MIINRTLVYGSLGVVLALVYLGGVVLLQRVFVVFTGQGSQVAVVASTLAIAALFNPLRRRVQAFVDRRFYRRKYDAAMTLAGFSSKLRDETDLDALNDEVVAVVKETPQPAHTSLWLRPAPAPKGGMGGRYGRAVWAGGMGGRYGRGTRRSTRLGGTWGRVGTIPVHKNRVRLIYNRTKA